MRERHRTQHVGWLRASVLGANDGILSTASLLVGVAAAHASTQDIIVAGVAGLAAGAMSMAAGEYVSVSSQADTEQADLRRERIELATDRKSEEEELAQIYVARGLDPTLARQVSLQLMQYDALGSHARDELGISATTTARPLQAAFASAASFAVGAALPLLLVFVLPSRLLIYGIFTTTVAFLALLGAIAAQVGGARLWRGAARVTFWGAAAMAVTAAIGTLFGKPV